MRVVSDTSVLIYCGKTGSLALLAGCFEEVIVVREVVRELGADSDEIRACRQVAGFYFPGPQQRNFSSTLQQCERMDYGELGVLHYAETHSVHTVLVDDAAGRRCAQALGLRVVGLLGVLRIAKRTGAIPAVRPLADAAIAAGYRIRPSVYAAFLHRIGEA